MGSTLPSIDDLDRIHLAPFPQRAFRGFGLEVVPLLKRALASQQLLESGVGARTGRRRTDRLKEPRGDDAPPLGGAREGALREWEELLRRWAPPAPC